MPDSSYSGTQDSYLVERSLTLNFGTEEELKADGVQFDSNSGQYGEVASLVQWDVSAIPATAVVTAASITFDFIDASSGTYKILTQHNPWSEGTATWNDLNTSNILGIIPPFSFGQVTINLNAAGVAIVQGWVNGLIPNNGVAIRTGGTNNGIEMNSSESGEFRPKLEVIYSSNPNNTALNKTNLYFKYCEIYGQEGKDIVGKYCACDDEEDIAIAGVCAGDLNGTLNQAGNSMNPFHSGIDGISGVTCLWKKPMENTGQYNVRTWCFDVNGDHAQ